MYKCNLPIIFPPNGSNVLFPFFASLDILYVWGYVLLVLIKSDEALEYKFYLFSSFMQFSIMI